MLYPFEIIDLTSKYTFDLSELENISRFSVRFLKSSWVDTDKGAVESLHYPCEMSKGEGFIDKVLLMYKGTMESKMRQHLENNKTGVISFTPANKMGYVNTPGKPLYVFKYPDLIVFESNFLIHN